MLMYEFGIPAFAPGSENTPVPEEVLENIKKRFNRVIVVMDNDNAGLTAEQSMMEKHPELEYYHLPQNTAKDFSDYYKAFGKQKTKDLLTSLNWING